MSDILHNVALAFASCFAVSLAGFAIVAACTPVPRQSVIEIAEEIVRDYAARERVAR